MRKSKTPKLPDELFKRIRLVRRDFGSLLFHFTRSSNKRAAIDVIRKILYDGRLKGTSRWSYGQKCVCFTEAPIQEFNSIFSLVEIAASESERPRYEPYGIGVSKRWFFEKGGRPVIYDHPNTFSSFPEDQKYRLVKYDPVNGKDYTWEREWRIKVNHLNLDPRETLVVVPTSDEAFELVYEFAEVKPDGDEDGPWGVYHKPKWLAVSLDIFGFGQ